MRNEIKAVFFLSGIVPYPIPFSNYWKQSATISTFAQTANMFLKIINSALIIFAVYMGLKQGWAMLNGDPKMLDMFNKWNFSKYAVKIFGVVTMISSLLVLFPKTFIFGNFLMATTILLIICFHLSDKDLKAAAIELPFFLLNFVIIYLQHPLSKQIK